MRFYSIEENKNLPFIGRLYEQDKLQAIDAGTESVIIVMYGRRRVGKTSLLEHVFKNRNILKFEGIEGLPEDKQRAHLVKQFAYYLEDPVTENLTFTSWTDFLIAVYEKTKNMQVTLYFEELQWIADYEKLFIAELKYVWDNFFKRNNKLIIILCGSSASFMINNVIHSQALYNRSQHEIYLSQLSLTEAGQLLNGKSKHEILDAYLALGGIPEYLNMLKSKKSVFVSLCKESFTKDGFFVQEFSKVFTSALAKNKHYKQIINMLAVKKFATREEIATHLKISSGGNLTDILTDLEKSDFIEKYAPYSLASTSKLARYTIKDQYLQFYYKFIAPIINKIKHGDFNDDPVKAINVDAYNKWQGFAFERLCRNNHKIIARKLGFVSVKYESGAFYSKSTNHESPGYQIDLLFDRDDKVITICEIKYLRSQVTTSVIEEFERKLMLFPNKKNKTIHKVLITVNGVTESLRNAHYFDEYIDIDDML